MRGSLLANILPTSNSQTTLELRHFIEAGACLFDTGNKQYPIWREDHREELNTKIIEHYANRQIGFETFGRFKYELNVRMREIMPYYIDIWKTTQYEYNPIENYAMREGSEDNATSEGETTTKALEKYADTPQNVVDNIDDHLTTATQNDAKGSSTGKSNTKHTAWRNGNIGVTTSQQMIQSERDITINIDVMIIDELRDLFLAIF